MKEDLSTVYLAESLKTIGPDDAYPVLADIRVDVCIHQYLLLVLNIHFYLCLAGESSP